MKTLYAYLGRELAKVTFLALLAFTLIMTVFAIIEPLRRYGLAVEGALWLVVLTLPTMMSLTLPIAALFAATIVYGRFSQDNEMVACRASGISTISILKPAILLGAAVTIVSLTLNSFITPRVVRMAQTALQANGRSIAYHMLRSQSGVRWKGKNWVIHADRIDEATDSIDGLVVIRPRLPRGNESKGGALLVVAPKALIQFTTRNGQTWLRFDSIDAAMASTRQGEYSFAETDVPPLVFKLPSLVEENAAWYDWPKMVRILRNPAESKEVRSFLSNIRRKLCNTMLAGQIARSIQAGKAYQQLKDSDGAHAYYVDAGSAKVGAGGVLHLSAGLRAGKFVPVQVVVMANGEPYQIVTGQSGTIEARASEFAKILGSRLDSFVTIKLTNAKVRTLTAGAGDVQYRQSWSIGQLPMPTYVTDKARAVPLNQICSRAKELTGDDQIQRWVTFLRDKVIKRLTDKVTAEMNVRLAYSLSCLLMVATGAALGLMLRGGQVMSAFAISVIPAALVITMMVTGKQMATNPAVPLWLGLVVIWLGVVMLLAADLTIYYRLSRK